MLIKLKLLLLTLVLLYSCENEGTKNKFSIKTLDNKYISLSPDGFILNATQTDSVKAEVFEMIEMGNKQIALKTSWGKFVTLEMKPELRLIGKEESAGDWETFKFIKLSNGNYNIMAFNDRYVCCDRALNNLIVANRDKASDWETFILEPK